MNIDSVLDANRAAIDELIVAAERAESNWTTPREPRKWSPSQVVEHVARTLEEGAHVVAGEPSKFPTLPSFVRPALRGLFFSRILKKRAFSKAKTMAAFNPERGPETPAAARERLLTALAAFDSQSRARVASGKDVVSGVFGHVSVEDYARFQELHTRHHCGQIPEARY